MAYADRKARKARQAEESVSHPDGASWSGRGSLDVPRQPIEMRRGGSEDECGFAREVVITGYRVVGGRTWSDKARMGAYVGELLRTGRWDGTMINSCGPVRRLG
jgi:hypothetical protein